MKKRLLFLVFLGLSLFVFGSLFSPKEAYARACSGVSEPTQPPGDTGCGAYDDCFCSSVDNNKYCVNDCGGYIQTGTNCGNTGGTVSPPPVSEDCGSCQNMQSAGCCDVNIPYKEGKCSGSSERCGEC